MITENDLRAIAKGLADIRVERSRVGQIVGAGRDGEQRGMEWAWELVCALAGRHDAHVRVHRLRSNVACVDQVVCLRCGREHCPVDEACNWRRETFDRAGSGDTTQEIPRPRSDPGTP